MSLEIIASKENIKFFGSGETTEDFWKFTLITSRNEDSKRLKLKTRKDIVGDEHTLELWTRLETLIELYVQDTGKVGEEIPIRGKLERVFDGAPIGDRNVEIKIKKKED